MNRSRANSSTVPPGEIKVSEIYHPFLISQPQGYVNALKQRKGRVSYPPFLRLVELMGVEPTASRVRF